MGRGNAPPAQLLDRNRTSALPISRIINGGSRSPLPFYEVHSLFPPRLLLSYPPFSPAHPYQSRDPGRESRLI